MNQLNNINEVNNEVKVVEAGPEALKLYNEILGSLSDSAQDEYINSVQDESIMDVNEPFISPISYDDNCMNYTDFVKFYTVRISNFTLKPVYKVRSGNNEIYYCMELKNKKESIRTLMNAEILTSNKAFRQFVRSKGDFAWLGNQYRLDYLNEYLIEMFDCNEVVEINYIGYQRFEDGNTLQDGDLWVFPDFAFFNGEVIFPNEDGIFITEKKSYMLNKFLIDNLEIKVHYVDEEFEADLVKILLRDLYKLYGNQLFLGIGYMMATMQISCIEKITNEFPFYSPNGITHSGKTEYLNLISKFAGVEVKFTSPPEKIDVLRKQVSFYSHLPYGYDEAQDDGNNTSFYKRHEAALKAYFNRQNQFRGDKDILKVYNYPIRCSLIFAGEIAVNNSALSTRSILVDSASFTHDQVAFKNVRSNKELILGMGQYMMKESGKWRDTYIEAYHESVDLIDQYITGKVLSRVRNNYAVLLAGAKVFLQNIEQHFKINLNVEKVLDELINFSTKEMIKAYVVADENKNVVNYLTSIAYLAEKDSLVEGVHYKIDIDKNKRPKVLNLAIGDAWSAIVDSRLGTIYTSKNQVTNDVKTLPYFIKTNMNAQKKIGNKNLRVWCFDLQHPDIPEFFQHFSVSNN